MRLELDTAQARYSDLYDQAPVGYCTVSESWMILHANSNTAKLLGVARGTLCNRPFSSFILKQDQDKLYLLRKQIILTGEQQSCELLMVKNDGTPFWVQLLATATQYEADTPIQRIMLSDITQRKLAELALQESDETLHSILNTTLDGFWYVDRDGYLLDVNPAYCKQSGYTREELLKMQVCDLEANENSTEIAAHIKQIIADKHGQFETVQRRKDGSLWHAEVSATYRDVANGQFCVFLRDISERKAMQQVLITGKAQYRDQAFKLLNAVDSLRALAADTDAVRENEKKHIARELHDELGQLLAALRLHIGLLNMEYSQQLPELTAKTNGMLDILDRALASMRSVVAHLRPSALDMGLLAALEWLRDDFIRIFKIRCILSCNADMPKLDDMQLTIIFRIIQESLTNIAKHAKANVAHINLHFNNNLLQLSVQDNGIGFDLDSRRADPECFGLRGMRERALALNGELVIDTSPGKGCCMTLSIPMGEKNKS